MEEGIVGDRRVGEGGIGWRSSSRRGVVMVIDEIVGDGVGVIIGGNEGVVVG